MAKITEPLPWDLQTSTPYVPLSYQGEVVGFCSSAVAARLVGLLNEEERFQQALVLACSDLAAHTGSDPETMMQQYLALAERPKSGTRIIALLLQERQEELDVSDEEFAKFCDTFRLSREELRNLYAGEPIAESQLVPLSRILGLPMEELVSAWKGTDASNPSEKLNITKT